MEVRDGRHPDRAAAIRPLAEDRAAGRVRRHLFPGTQPRAWRAPSWSAGRDGQYREMERALQRRRDQAGRIRRKTATPMPGIPLLWEIVIAVSMIAGIVTLLTVLGRSGRHDDDEWSAVIIVLRVSGARDTHRTVSSARPGGACAPPQARRAGPRRQPDAAKTTASGVAASRAPASQLPGGADAKRAVRRRHGEPCGRGGGRTVAE